MVIIGEEMRNIVILKRNYFYLLVVGRVEFEEIIFTSWWLDELSLKKLFLPPGGWTS